MTEHYEQKRNTITEDGLKAIRERLEYLKTTGRAHVADMIATARAFGDLSENAEYDEAKNEQSRLEAEINELEAAVRTAVVIADEDITTDHVNIGTVVTLYDEDERCEEVYRIVGSHEADPMQNIISNESPMGIALIGKRKDEVAVVEAPDGVIRLRVLAIDRA